MNLAASDWLARRTSQVADWPADALALRKRARGTRVSVALPALDEEATVGRIVATVSRFAARTGLVDEIVVVDSGSSDRTAEVAAAAGARVHHRDDILPAHGSRPGKGEVLWKALAATDGDIVVYIDSDLTEFGEHYLTGLLGPLLCDDDIALVKAFYDRPLRNATGELAGGGGRVTELMARPLLNALFPELAGVVQPLAGEYAARRSLLERLPFAAGYGVETGLLIDTLHTRGLDSLAQVDLGRRAHTHQDTAALGRMAAAVLHTALRRAHHRYPRDEQPHPLHPQWTELTQFRRIAEAMAPESTAVGGPDRPPMLTIPEYAVQRAGLTA